MSLSLVRLRLLAESYPVLCHALAVQYLGFVLPVTADVTVPPLCRTLARIGPNRRPTPCSTCCLLRQRLDLSLPPSDNSHLRGHCLSTTTSQSLYCDCNFARSIVVPRLCSGWTHVRAPVPIPTSHACLVVAMRCLGLIHAPRRAARVAYADSGPTCHCLYYDFALLLCRSYVLPGSDPRPTQWHGLVIRTVTRISLSTVRLRILRCRNYALGAGPSPHAVHKDSRRYVYDNLACLLCRIQAQLPPGPRLEQCSAGYLCRPCVPHTAGSCRTPGSLLFTRRNTGSLLSVSAMLGPTRPVTPYRTSGTVSA